MRCDETALVEKNVRIECEREDLDASRHQRTPAVESSKRPQRGALCTSDSVQVKRVRDCSEGYFGTFDSEQQDGSQDNRKQRGADALLTLFKSRESGTVQRGTSVPLTLNNKMVVKTTGNRGMHYALVTLDKTLEVNMWSAATSEGYIMYC